MSEETGVSFACQRCMHPIAINDGFENINVHALAELCLPTCKGVVNAIDSQDANDFDRIVPPYVTDSINGTGFMLVSNRRDIKNLSLAFKLKAELFDSVSSNSEIDHPICEECTDTMLDIMDHELHVANQELHTYKKYLNKIEKHQIPDMNELQQTFHEMKVAEQKLVEELISLKQEKSLLSISIDDEKQEKQTLQKQEALYWREYTKHRRELMLTEDDKRSLECKISYAEQRFEQLKDANIFNITFHIWYAGHFGTINNFRLGRLPAASVDWSEINAAWGQTVLLLYALAHKLKLNFERYRIIPFGNHSFVEVLADNRELPLYGTGGFKFFWDTKFDAAMVAFLDCLTQFQKEVEKRDNEFVLPYKMEKGKIIDPSTGNSYSIKIQFNSEEQWTKALKFMLTNLKWGLAWVSSQFSN